MRYHKVKTDEWIRPKRKNYYMKCCDCGLVHALDFKLTKWGRGFKIWLRGRRVGKSL